MVLAAPGLRDSSHKFDACRKGSCDQAAGDGAPSWCTTSFPRSGWFGSSSLRPETDCARGEGSGGMWDSRPAEIAAPEGGQFERARSAHRISGSLGDRTQVEIETAHLCRRRHLFAHQRPHADLASCHQRTFGTRSEATRTAPRHNFHTMNCLENSLRHLTNAPTGHSPRKNGRTTLPSV